MKRQYILGLVSGIAISSVLVVNAAQTNTTIESCAQLLPPGETFELDINGKIDTNGQNPFFSGSFSLSDGTEIEYTDSQREKIVPFINCVKSLLK
jgi:hypothetical protein|tara:strand:- start:212 stop:496 length:285 start_codon:yes stop_codon:yes gene_type:complete